MKYWLFLIILPALVLTVLIGLGASTTVHAQQPVSDDAVNVVAKQLYCPVCENTPLDVCPTQACKDWRELIRQQLSAGWTEQQVLDYFASTYGPQVLAQPPVRGFSALVWILPIIGLAGGGIFLWRLLRRWQISPSPSEALAGIKSTAGMTDIAPDILARIEQEVDIRF